MRGRSVVAVALVVCWLLVGAAALSTPAAAAALEVEHTLEESPDPGEVDVETRFRIPTGTATLEVTLPEGTDVYEREGFVRTGDERTYEWTGATNEPYLRYATEGNVSFDGSGSSGHIYAVTDEWAVVRTPSISMEWSGPQSDVEVSTAVDGEGVAGRHVAYLGPYEEHVREASGQRFRLVVPEAAALRETPEAVLDAFEYAAGRLEIGHRDDEVLVVVAPAENAGVDWAATGVQRGDADMWIRDGERLSDPKNTWVHEYVHTRQEYDRTAETRWTVEGMADYYAALVSYERGHIDYETFRERMADGRDAGVSDVRLVDPETWTSNRGNYDKGALVFGHLDRRLRAETDTTLDAAIADANGGERLSQEAFLEAIKAAGGSDVRADAERYTETTAAPPVWSHEEHVAAFGGPDVRYGFEDFAVSGPYRETALDGPRIVAGETLTATVRVRNAGTDPTEFDAEFRVDGEGAAAETGALDPGEATTLTFDREFPAAGEYDLEVETATTTVVVEEPADLAVTGLEVEPASATVGDRVTLRATVESSADRPAAGELAFLVDGEPVATERVRTSGDANGTVVETTAAFDEPGEYAVTAGGRSTTVTVRDRRSIGDGSGLGPATALAALSAAILLYGRVRRR